MSFWRKLLYYLIGVGFGILMVIFFFGDREIGCSYFPNDRVLSDLRKKELVITPSVLSSELGSSLDSNLIQSFVLNGDIDFTKSTTRDADSCNIYWMDYEDDVVGALNMEWVNCDSTAYLIRLSK